MTVDSIPLPRLFSPACERNKEPIRDVLRRVLGPRGLALEVASGSGQHLACFAAGINGWCWQPTDRATTPAELAELDAVIDVYCLREGAERARIRPAQRLDVLDPADWSHLGRGYDLVYCANMLHIAPWACCPALLQGAARLLQPAGLLVTYGPYFDAEGDGAPPAPGNLAFDADLRARDPAWGIRQLGDVAREAEHAGLKLRERIALPANNLCLVFGRP